MEAREFLEKVRRGEMTIEAGVAFLQQFPFVEIPEAIIDTHRFWRKGFPEVVWGKDKEVPVLEAIIRSLRDVGQSVLITRLALEKAEKLKENFPEAQYDPEARIFSLGERMPALEKGQILVVTAGISDLPVAMEAKVTAEFMGARVNMLKDVGVAGVHRLFAHWDEVRKADVIIAVAGMEGALPGLVSSLVGRPVIAVPTSVGYGTHLAGLAPLLSMLNACSSGMAVVNVDNGFGAAVLAILILRLLNEKK